MIGSYAMDANTMILLGSTKPSFPFRAVVLTALLAGIGAMQLAAPRLISLEPIFDQMFVQSNLPIETPATAPQKISAPSIPVPVAVEVVQQPEPAQSSTPVLSQPAGSMVVAEKTIAPAQPKPAAMMKLPSAPSGVAPLPAPGVTKVPDLIPRSPISAPTKITPVVLERKAVPVLKNAVVPAPQPKKLVLLKQDAVEKKTPGPEQSEVKTDPCTAPLTVGRTISVSNLGVRSLMPGVLFYGLGGASCKLTVGSSLANGEHVKKIDADRLRIETDKRTIQLLDE